MRYLAVIAVLALAACGVDGPPVAPGAAAPEPGVSISGEARIGVVSSI
ncbi:hypothetical protein PE067_16870 [Paracoccus sp. DMF-8]|nr:hypothetical protein [Paracoccus sp. DMF-8]MDF3607663.1 hypothetical protein [Paracoccus sp. DMF-8]